MTKEHGIVGHKKQILQLNQDLESQNLSHAYLFAGAPFLGKTAVAHWFARRILTQHVHEEQKAEIVRQMDRLIHPDFLVLDQLWMEDKMESWEEIARTSNIPQQHRAKAGTKTDIITIDDVREIQQRLLETGDLPWRVCIIRGIERVNDAAANAFLKILEEPPPGRMFILTTESPALLLPTILSRTRVLRFERAPDRDIQAIVQKEVVEEDASFIVHVAQGAPGVAFRLLADPDALRAEKLLHTHAVSFWAAPTLLDRIRQLEPLTERGEEAQRLLFHISLALREFPGYQRQHERALNELMRTLKTNAHRGLAVQHFAMQTLS